MKALVVGTILLCACASGREDKKPRPAHEIVTGAGRIRGGGVRMDVTVGNAFAQTPARGGTNVIKQGTVTP